MNQRNGPNLLLRPSADIKLIRQTLSLSLKICTPLTPSAVPSSVRNRLPPAERRRLIIEAATEFFAEYGFEGGTTALARKLGVAQSLLYRYFDSKDQLIREVYEHAFPSRQYYARWLEELDEAELPLRDRLVRFYCDYAQALLNPTFLRLTTWARLSRADLNRKYNKMLDRAILPRIVRALRAEAGLDPGRRVSVAELELVRTLHGSIYYVALRRMQDRLPGDFRAVVISKIDLFLDGARAVIRRRQEMDSLKGEVP